MQKKIIISLLCISLLINGALLYETNNSKTLQNNTLPDYQKYPLLSKRIFTESPNDIILNFIPLRQALNEYVSEQNGNVGVYFEYLPSGISIGVNDREEVALASLSKVPLAMSIVKKIERTKMTLGDTLVVKKDDLDTKFGDLWKRGEGTRLSVEDLIKLSLIESDNTAYNVLFNQLTGNEVNEVYDNLDIKVNTKEKIQLVSPKSYSSIFRSLYLSSFLSEKDSFYLLDMLTRSKFNNKIIAGVPAGTIVSHKIGILSRTDSKSDVFTDCGIIYIPQRPYILCVFVKNSSEENSAKKISYISNMIYKYVSMIKKDTP